MLKKFLSLSFIITVLFVIPCFAFNHGLEDSTQCSAFTLSPRISFSELIFRRIFTIRQSEEFREFKKNSDMHLSVNSIIKVSSEVEYVEKLRQQMNILVNKKDVRALEEIISLQDALADKEKDWMFLTEAVAARNSLGFSKNEYLKNKYQKNLFWCPRNVGRRDLHIHTQFTDGLKDLDSIMQEAVQRVIKVIAITDHNTMDGVEKFVETAAKYGIEVIPGVEVSVSENINGDKGDIGVEFHVIGYGIDMQDVKLKAVLKRISALFYFKYLNILYDLLDHDTDCVKEDIIGKVKSVYIKSVEDHIALYKKHKMNDLTQKTRDDLESLTENDWQKYFSLIIQINSDKPIKLTESDIKFIEKFAICNDAQPRAIELARERLEKKLLEKGIDFRASKYGVWNLENNFLPKLPQTKEIIDIIHDAGGVAIFAHPRWYTDIVLQSLKWHGDKKGFITSYIKEIAELGIDGVEAFTNWTDRIADGYYADLTNSLNLMITHGTDSHFRGKEKMGIGLEGSFYMPLLRVLSLEKKSVIIQCKGFWFNQYKFKSCNGLQIRWLCEQFLFAESSLMWYTLSAF